MSEQAYLNLLQDILDNGEQTPIFGHTDKYLLSCIGTTLKFDLTKGFPVLSTKKTFYKGSFVELLWFIEGSGNIPKLHKQGVKYWNCWGVKHWNITHNTNLTKDEYSKLIDEGVITDHCIPLHYTNMTNWKYTNWEATQLDSEYRFSSLDQTKWLIDYIKQTPERKSFMVMHWDPETTYQQSETTGRESVELPACPFYHHVLLKGNKLTLVVGIRSSDAFLGLPLNIAQYALLAHMYAHVLDKEANQVIFHLNDYHAYSNLKEQIKEQLTRQPYELPQLNIADRGQQYLQDFSTEDFQVVNYKSHPALKGELTIVGGY